MKTFFQSILLLSVIQLSVSCTKDNEAITQQELEEIVVIANRNSGSISFIDAGSNKFLKSLNIEGSEPMYIVYVKEKDRLYVGDRVGKKIHIIDPVTRKVTGTIEIGNGLFHMWASKRRDRLWTVNDFDDFISVIDLNTNEVIKNIHTPGTPHDIFVSSEGTKVFVSVSNTNSLAPERILLYRENTVEPIAIASVGLAPHAHLYYIEERNELYVPTESGNMYVLDGNDLTLSNTISFPTGVHGIFPSPNKRHLYLSSISNKQLHVFDMINGNVIQTVETESNAPHNITVNEGGTSLYVTHSGASGNKVSVYSINSQGLLNFNRSITAGNNPFGIAYYSREK